MQRRVLVTLLVFWPIAGLACSGDSDCKPGSTCLKASGSITGLCVEGISPGNQSDQEAPLDPNGTNGKACSFDTDCGTGSRCVKNSTFDGGLHARPLTSGAVLNRRAHRRTGMNLNTVLLVVLVIQRRTSPPPA